MDFSVYANGCTQFPGRWVNLVLLIGSPPKNIENGGYSLYYRLRQTNYLCDIGRNGHDGVCVGLAKRDEGPGYLIYMLNQIILLFSLNLLDALLTIVWVRSGVATEGNQLMAGLLNVGNLPFLTVKVMIGAVTATVLFRYSDKPLAALRFGGVVSSLFGTVARTYRYGTQRFWVPFD